MDLLDYAAAKLHEEMGVFKLLVFLFILILSVCKFQNLPFQVMDSVMALFRVDFSGRGELADRQQKLAQLLSRLQKISEGSQDIKQYLFVVEFFSFRV